MIIRHPKKNLAAVAASEVAPAPTPARPSVEPTAVQRPAANRAQVDTLGTQNRRLIRNQLYDQIDPLKAAALGREALRQQVEAVIRKICDDSRLQLSRQVFWL